MIIRKQFDRFLSTTEKAKREPINRFENIEGESVTVPNDAMTIQEIMERAMKGQEPVYQNVVYNPVDHIDQINNMFVPGFDLSDLDIIRRKSEELESVINNARLNIGEEIIEVNEADIVDPVVENQSE